MPFLPLSRRARTGKTGKRAAVLRSQGGGASAFLALEREKESLRRILRTSAAVVPYCLQAETPQDLLRETCRILSDCHAGHGYWIAAVRADGSLEAFCQANLDAHAARIKDALSSVRLDAPGASGNLPSITPNEHQNHYSLLLHHRRCHGILAVVPGRCVHRGPDSRHRQTAPGSSPIVRRGGGDFPEDRARPGHLHRGRARGAWG